MTEAPQWALDEAAQRARWDDFEAISSDKLYLLESVRAHALTIAKHETPPVDRDLEKARELMGALSDLLVDKNFSNEARGIWLQAHAVELLAAIKWARQEANT